MTLLDDLRATLGDRGVLTGAAMAPYSQDWTGVYRWTPLAVLRPRSTQDVSAALRLTHAAGVPTVPVGGNTGLTGATHADGAVMLSLEAMDQIEEISTQGRTATVGAGVILSNLHETAEAQGLAFPMTFGARGSARIGGLLSTNAGGSNVLRYGNTRDLCLGLEVVLADGQVMNLMSKLHKDNSGLALKHMFIGAEGTLGVITRAVLKLVPLPRARATAMVAAKGLPEALTLLNQLQEATDGLVDAFEYMPRTYVSRHLAMFPDASEPFEAPQDVNILVELAATADRDAVPGEDGQVPLTGVLEAALAQAFEAGTIVDAVIAQSETQRRTMWARREAAAELAHHRKPFVDGDVAVPLDAVAPFLDAVEYAKEEIDPGCQSLVVSHLGDGNIHLSLFPTRDTADLKDALKEMMEDVALRYGGSFSAEHGVGLDKRASMARRKDPVALATMRAIKSALDPKGLMNPGKMLPD